MHILEKFTRKGDEILYEITVDDPDVFVEPWVIPARTLRLNAAPAGTSCLFRWDREEQPGGQGCRPSAIRRMARSNHQNDSPGLRRGLFFMPQGGSLPADLDTGSSSAATAGASTATVRD